MCVHSLNISNDSSLSRFFTGFTLATLFLLVFLLPSAAYSADLGEKTHRLFSTKSSIPYEEWELDYSGAPSSNEAKFDVEARVTFTHSSGTKISTSMFYAGGTKYKFRFTGTKTGDWTFKSSSSHGALNGHTGRVKVVSDSSNRNGFLTKIGNKWAWGNTKKVFVPQLVMYRYVFQMYNNTKVVSGDISNLLDSHGFNGFHVSSISGNWFNAPSSDNVVYSKYKAPDPRAFETLEKFIVETYNRGYMVHLWMWGDAQRKTTGLSLSGGFNSQAYKRLVNYLAARLGPVPGWSMGFGFDNYEWDFNGVNTAKLSQSMKQKSGWFHFVGSRPKGPTSGTNHSAYNGWNSKMDYASYEHWRPTYDVYLASIKANPGKPVFSEDRFRLNATRPTIDYNLERIRRGLWHSTMAGGVANIWGNLKKGEVKPGITNRKPFSQAFPNRKQIKAYADFFFKSGRFQSNSTADNSKSTGSTRVLKTGSNYIFYAESVDKISIKLGSGSFSACGLDTAAATTKNLGKVDGNSTINLGKKSDWAIAVGDARFACGNSNNPPPPPPPPAPTSTPRPMATNTPVPQPTNTPVPTVKPTDVPRPTNTPIPTSIPEPTNTPMPNATSTPVANVPTATPTQRPPRNTPTPRPTVEVTSVPTPVPTVGNNKNEGEVFNSSMELILASQDAFKKIKLNPDIDISEAKPIIEEVYSEISDFGESVDRIKGIQINNRKLTRAISTLERTFRSAKRSLQRYMDSERRMKRLFARERTRDRMISRFDRARSRFEKAMTSNNRKSRRRRSRRR